MCSELKTLPDASQSEGVAEGRAIVRLDKVSIQDGFQAYKNTGRAVTPKMTEDSALAKHNLLLFLMVSKALQSHHERGITLGEHVLSHISASHGCWVLLLGSSSLRC